MDLLLDGLSPQQALEYARSQSNVLSLGGRVRDFTADLATGGVTADVYQVVFALLLTEALVESGRALGATRVLVSPLGPRGWTCCWSGSGTPTVATAPLPAPCPG